MQEVGIDAVDSQMNQGAGEALADLLGQRSVGIVREASVLAAKVGELGLKERGGAPRGDGATDRSLVVVFALVGSIDPGESRTERAGRGRFGVPLLPGRSVQHRRHQDAPMLEATASAEVHGADPPRDPMVPRSERPPLRVAALSLRAEPFALSLPRRG